ncbi:9336_t:CDS:2, partial [Gigaspora margarita]
KETPIDTVILKKKDFSGKELEEASELWIKKLLDKLDKVLENEPKDVRALENEKK